MISMAEATELVVRENLSSEKEVVEYIRDNHSSLNISDISEGDIALSLMKQIINSDVDNKEILRRTRKECKLTRTRVRPEEEG